MPEPKPSIRRRSDADRRIRQAERLARILRLLALIQGRSNWSQQDLARELGCSERTVFRDLKVLEFAGIPWYFDTERKCYRAHSKFQFAGLHFSRKELVGLGVAASITDAIAFADVRAVQPIVRKISGSLSDESSQILEDAVRFTFVLAPKCANHKLHQLVLQTALSALAQRKQLIGKHATSSTEGAREITLHPLRLCLVKQDWYLIAQRDTKPVPEAYRVAQFHRLRVTEKDADIPEHFDVANFIGNAWEIHRGDKRYVVEIEFASEASPLVVEKTWHHTQQVKRRRDGTTRLSFELDGLEEVLRWVLGWSGRAKVIRPRELKILVQDQLRAGLKLNQ